MLEDSRVASLPLFNEMGENIFVPTAIGDYPPCHYKIDVIPPGTICNETYLVIGHYGSKKQVENLVAYMKTRIFRFLVSQFMYSHHITKEACAFVPILDMKRNWADADLIARYGLSADEVKFIQSKIRPFDKSETGKLKLE